MEQEKTETRQKIVTKLIEEEMKKSYIDYAMSVIVGRALPDVRDGLKPVHRRILYAMHELGMFHNKPFKKCARIVGECLGKFHPHGDTAVYDALTRMVQDFSLRYPLIQGQGNFGSVDGDNQAAMRYTEARLARTAEELLQDIDKETVDFQPNFDDSLKEPVVLPAKLPNLLLNGSAGIAVGMATNIPPHNIRETVDGTIALIDNPEMHVKDLLKYIKGPDFPTGAVIHGRRGIISAYSTGSGRIKVKAKIRLEEKNGKRFLIVTEIPYMVNKSVLLEHMAGLVKEKQIKGIADLRDESDREGMRIVIELKKDANPDVVQNQLFKHTRLQSTFGINILALVDNEPKILNLKQIIQLFIKHRKDVITRRTGFELKKAEERAHILEGIIVALKDIDAVITKIKKSKNMEEAKISLMKNYQLSKTQAKAILDMKLQKLASTEQQKIREEHDSLKKLVYELKSILDSEQKISGLIKKELIEIKERYSDDRRTDIIDVEEDEEIEIEDLIKEEEMVVTVTHFGYVKRLPLTTYRQQGRGGRGIIGTITKKEDFVEELFVTSTHAYLLFFTNKGKVHWLKVYKIPEAGRYAIGSAIVNLISLEKEEKITAMIPIKKFDNKHYLVMVTNKGIIKKTNLNAYSKPRKGGIVALTLDQNDQLVSVKLTDGTKKLIIATKKGHAIKFNENNVRPMGRTARGVKGISLRQNDEVIGMIIADSTKTLLTVTENGYGKRTPISDYRLTSRGGKGIINIKCSEKNKEVVSIKNVSNEDELMLITKHGLIIRIAARNISVIGRNTQGVRLMKLKERDKVVAAAKTVIK